MDVLSEVLQQVRLAGAVLFRSTFHGPWCIAARPEAAVVAESLPGASQLISFHVVLGGALWACLGDGEPLQVEAGEVLVLPHGDAYVIGDSPNGLPVPAEQFLRGTPLANARELHWGSGEQCTRVLCGYLGCERQAFTPLFEALPRMFKVRLQGTDGAGGLLAFAEHEAVADWPGAHTSRLRVAELMFIETLRRYMETLPAQHGWLAGLRDPVVGRARALLHAQPDSRWTVSGLALRAATSRSVLAQRFVDTLGEPPMQYLSRWRMLVAARRLREGRDSVARIAESVGYESPAAFQRSFLRHMGTTPARWRRGAAVVNA